MGNENIVKFLSADIKTNPTNLKKEPIEVDLASDKEDEQLAMFFRFVNKILDADNLVVLAGSGTSLTFNDYSTPNQQVIAPSMWHLWNDCKNQDEALFRSVLEDTQYDVIQTHKGKEDIELLLSLCDSYLALGNLSKTKNDQLERFLTQAKNTILAKTNFTESISSSDWFSHDKFMRAVGRRNAQQQRLKLFTTNYDLAFEQAASNTGFVVIDGFEFSNPSFFNPMWFKYDIVNRGHSKSSESAYIPNVVQLYKMHGSVDWRKINGRVRKIGADSEIGEPVFIYPSSSKYQTSYDSPYLDMMTSFLEVVKQPKTALLCLGFGFNDKHINNAITMALRTNPEFMLMVGTKDPFSETGSFNREIRELLLAAIDHGDGRIAIMDSTFKQFSSLLPQRRSSTPEDELFKAFEQITAKIK